jgi:hypothetical protein
MNEGTPKITIRLNIASAGNGLPTVTREQLARIAESSALVDVYAMGGSPERPVGRVLSYEMTGDDLWAVCELDERAPGARATALIAQSPDGSAQIKAVVLSSLQKAMLEAAGAGLSFEQAEHYSVSRSAWKRRKPS